MYNEDFQLDPSCVGLKESMAWPAKPQDTYGFEKLYAEEMALAYAKVWLVGLSPVMCCCGAALCVCVVLCLCVLCG